MVSGLRCAQVDVTDVRGPLLLREIETGWVSQQWDGRSSTGSGPVHVKDSRIWNNRPIFRDWPSPMSIGVVPKLELEDTLALGTTGTAVFNYPGGTGVRSYFFLQPGQLEILQPGYCAMRFPVIFTRRPIGKIRLLADGSVEFYGVKVDAKQLKKQLAVLVEADGLIRYHRANSEGEPPSNWRQTRDILNGAQLPIRRFSTADSATPLIDSGDGGRRR